MNQERRANLADCFNFDHHMLDFLLSARLTNWKMEQGLISITTCYIIKGMQAIIGGPICQHARQHHELARVVLLQRAPAPRLWLLGFQVISDS